MSLLHLSPTDGAPSETSTCLRSLAASWRRLHSEVDALPVPHAGPATHRRHQLPRESDSDLSESSVLRGDLPSYGEPPVVEAAVAIQFSPIADLTVAHLGLFWEKVRDLYPNVDAHPPLPRVEETPGPPRPVRLGLQLESGVPELRIWFLSRDKTHLLQVQHDRLVYNWRKLDGDAPYPRYDKLRENLIQEYGRFDSFLEKEGLKAVEPDQAELTYVNHVPVAGDGRWSLPHRITRLWRDLPERTELPPPESVEFQSHYAYYDGDELIGRLHVQFTPIYAGEASIPAYRLQLTGRGAPRGDGGLDGALEMLDREHEWIVRSFTEITTEEMHRGWKRLQ